MSQNSVSCIAPSRGRADRIVHGLKEAGYSSGDISALFLDPDAGDGHPSGRGASAPANAATIESAGAIRGVLGWIAGVRRMAIPAVAPLIAAGPLAAALSAATTGGVAGGLIDFGIPPAEARCYEGRILAGAFFVSVQQANPDKSDRAREIFAAEGAENICTMTTVSTPNAAGTHAAGMPRLGGT